jgi:hypothetical protein
MHYLLFDRAYAKDALNRTREMCARAGLTVGDLFTLLLRFPAIRQLDSSASVLAYVIDWVGHECPAIVSAVSPCEPQTEN